MFKIVEKKSLNPTVSKITVEAPLIAKKAEPGVSGSSAGNRCNLRGGAPLCGDSERRVPFRASAFFRADVQLLLGFPSA